MSCTNPYKAFTIGHNVETGKRKFKITKRDVDYIKRSRTSGNPFAYISCFGDPPENDPDVITEFDYVPCGKCLSCRLSKSADWAVRCMLEAESHPSSYFVTLTYNDDTLPFNIDIDTGELSGKSTVVKSDCQKFIKRLRKNYSYNNRIRYLCSSEYGGISFRSHYHFILFGLILDDLKFYKKSSLGYNLYTSEFLNKCWSHRSRSTDVIDFYGDDGKPYSYNGYVIVADVSFESCAYVSRYTMKKQGDSDPDIYDDFLMEKEFLTCSLKPGIGYDYYMSHKSDIYKYDSIILKDGKVVKPPKYFDRLLERDDPTLFEEVKARRKKLAQLNQDNALALSDYDIEQFFTVKDFYLKERTKSLKRKEL